MPNELTIPRIVIAGTNSGVGKTTIVTGLLAALKRRGLNVQSYKVGPDYIDPGYHRLASGKQAHNLDTWLVPREHLAELFAKTAAGNDIAIIEGVMGLYDGGRNGVSSTAAIAKELSAPVILVVDAKSAGESVAAVALGFKNYDPSVNIAGVIVNRLGSSSHKMMVAEALERLRIPVLGAIYRNDQLIVPERHLGLTPVEETEAADRVQEMGNQIERDVAIEEIIKIAKKASPLTIPEALASNQAKTVRIGVAMDEGFSFYYPESLAVLENLGAEIIPFSPLRDKEIPDVDGLIFGGGFPEMFVAELAANTEMKQAVAAAAKRGVPVYAECGGLMYLARQIIGFDGQTFDMVGLVPAVCAMQTKLQTVGYVEAESINDNILCRAGEKLRGHEFHFSRMEPDSMEDGFHWAFKFCKLRTGDSYPGGYAKGSVVASYLHMHFKGNPHAAERFIGQCREYRGGKKA